MKCRCVLSVRFNESIILSRCVVAVDIVDDGAFARTRVLRSHPLCVDARAARNVAH